MKIARTDKSVLGQWWWTIDRVALGAVFVLIIFGLVMVTAASPAVAERIGLPSFHFVIRHIIFLIPSIIIMLGVSLLSERAVWRLGSIMCLGALVLMAATLFIGTEIKGAARWIHIAGFSLQPSEFIKPAFAIVGAWLIALESDKAKFPGRKLTTALFALIMLLLWLQPDFGMSAVVTAIFGGQLFLAGMPLSFIAILVGLAVGGGFTAYFTFPHVASRIDRFLDPTSGDNYQVRKSLEAFNEGGVLGTGPGQGTVKLTLPDAHADFIFAVAGEELGLIWSLVIISLFMLIIWRGLHRIRRSGNMFIILAVGSILVQFGIQTLIHMGSSLQLLPAKGMTLPFISYGGSSLLAMAFALGMVLALTRKQTNTYATGKARQSRAADIIKPSLKGAHT